MSVGTAGTSSGAAAAAARRRRREEEEMTSYSPRDLEEGWEFKILRSQTAAFGDPERMRAALAQEAQAGWTLVEKFDNSRIRLKRPASARARDDSLGHDPYRTNYGMREGTMVGIILAVTFALLAAVLGLVATLKK